MRTITRYVLVEFLKVFSVTLIGMTVVILLFVVAREAVDQGLGIKPLVRLIPYAIPVAMRFAVPGTVLLAVTSVYGRMSASNEVVAIKSLGLSPLAVVWPVVVAASLVSLASVWLNDVAVSWGRLGLLRVAIESVEETVYSILRTRKEYSNGRITINVQDVQGRRLIQPTIILKPHGIWPAGKITASEAELRRNPNSDELTIDFLDATFDFGEEASAWSPGRQPWVIPLADFSRKGGGSSRPSELPLNAIPEEITRQQDKIVRLRQQGGIRAVYQLMTGEFQSLMDSQWRANERRIAAAQHALHRLQTEPYRRWANGFSCLCFAIVGIPMAIRFRHAEFLASFFACFLPILLVYYPFLMVSVDQAKEGKLPPQSVWTGNLVLVMAGFWLFRRVIRY